MLRGKEVVGEQECRHNARGGASSASPESEEPGGDDRGVEDGLKEKAFRRRKQNKSNQTPINKALKQAVFR